MARQDQVDALRTLGERLNALEKDRLFRESYGPLSLSERMNPIFGEIQDKISVGIDHGSLVSDDTMNNFVSYSEQMINLMDQLISLDENQFAIQKDAVASQIESTLFQVRTLWPEVYCAALGTLNLFDESKDRVGAEYAQRMVEEVQRIVEETVASAKSESEEIIRAAKDEAEGVKSSARRTAEGVSVEAAQDQFKEAQELLRRQTRNWARLSVGSLVVFFGVCATFFVIGVPKGDGYLNLIYNTTIRITVLMAIGAVSAFCLRIYRAHLHMGEKNKHRQRVANSIEAFLNSTASDEQRDLILAQLVESVTQFGSSGLLAREDDNVYRPRVTVDTILKSLSSSSERRV